MQPIANHAEIMKGIEEFNSREFFDCHETLEDVWREYTGTDRECIQGIIQIAVGYYHYLRSNYVGALKLLTRGHARVSRFSPSWFGLDVQRFVDVISSDIDLLRATPSGREVRLAVPRIESIEN